MSGTQETQAVPPRQEWPVLVDQAPEGAALTDVILAAFRLNGRLQDAAQNLAAEGEITAAWWQVIGGVLDEPRTVADVGRLMGMTRQGVQRIADLLVARGLAEYRENPAHRRAKLLACTEAGYWAVRRISLAQHPWADRIGGAVGEEELGAALVVTERLVAVLERDVELAGTSRRAHNSALLDGLPDLGIGVEGIVEGVDQDRAGR